MAAPNLADANIEYTFPPEEVLAAKILDPLKILWYQTKYAQAWKQRNSIPASEGPETDRSYFLKLAELDGRLNAIQEIMDDHRTALLQFNEVKQTGVQKDGGNTVTIQTIAHSAGSQVHNG